MERPDHFEVMTPLSEVFALPITAVLDQATFGQILREGHTRIPVFDGEAHNIVAILLSKNLLGIGFERGLALREVLQLFGLGRDVLKVHSATTLNVALEICKAEKRHLLVVTDGAADMQAVLAAMGGAPVGLRRPAGD